MTHSELTELMHAVLDGEATAAQKRELERRLASDPAARADFDALRGAFRELEALPPAHPPEGLVAAVMAELPPYQLSPPPRVISVTRHVASDTNTVRRTTRSWPFSGSESMSKQKVSKRKVWIGAGLVALAAGIIVSSGIDFPPGGTSTTGAIVPAQRYRADQPATTGVGQTNPADAQRSAQPVAGNVGEARSPDGRSVDRSTDRSAERSTDRSAERAVDRSTERAAERAVDRSADRAVDRSTERAVDRSADRAVDRSTERASDRTAEQRQAP